ncbi:MAG: hypothetical protein PVJ34_01830 [Anaerolineae bacterium]
MKKNSLSKDRKNTLGAVTRSVGIVVILFGLLVPVAVHADLKATAVVYAWDVVADKYQNSNVITAWDGSWVPFLHELNFDTDLWLDACPAGPSTSTTLAGNMYYGLYHTDNAPAGGEGFQETRSWSLVDCDRNGNGRFDNADLSLQPPTDVTVLAACNDSSDICYLDPALQDVETPCTTGNCQQEIVTTFFINIDPNCDGTPDLVSPSGHLCFFAEARTPAAGEGTGIPWSGPLQARISTVGGDKTVNFSIQPTAVTLSFFGARATSDKIVVKWETASEINNVGFNLYRADSLDAAPTKLNAGLIPSQAPGSTSGAVYRFFDEDVQIGRTYFYWLEDVDIYGMSTRHGPVKVVFGLVSDSQAIQPRPRRLPGR